MILRTYLLVVKLFRPDPSLGKITGEMVMKWLRQVLAQHGAREKGIAGAVTDAGSDISTVQSGVIQARVVLSSHTCSTVSPIDGTGMANSRGASKNTDARDLFDVQEGCRALPQVYWQQGTSAKNLRLTLSSASDRFMLLLMGKKYNWASHVPVARDLIDITFISSLIAAGTTLSCTNVAPVDGALPLSLGSHFLFRSYSTPASPPIPTK